MTKCYISEINYTHEMDECGYYPDHHVVKSRDMCGVFKNRHDAFNAIFINVVEFMKTAKIRDHNGSHYYEEPKFHQNRLQYLCDHYNEEWSEMDSVLQNFVESNVYGDTISLYLNQKFSVFKNENGDELIIDVPPSGKINVKQLIYAFKKCVNGDLSKLKTLCEYVLLYDPSISYRFIIDEQILK